MEKNIEYIGEGIDRLITLDIRARGVIYNLYAAARELTGGPIALMVARSINEAIKKGGSVVITTGFIVLPQKIQETDGPLGAAALAKSLSVAFDVSPIFITEESSKGIMASTLRALGMDVKKEEDEFDPGDKKSALVLSFPLESREAEEEAERILDKFDPSLVIAIEKAGRNAKGEYHTMRGMNISPFHAKIEPLIEGARNSGILTVGIGDGGNEVGMGNIKSAVEKFVPYAKVCQCACKGGIAAESRVDELVVASISNWGAYGIEACIAALTGKDEALHTPEEEERMLKFALEAGAVDGVTGKPQPSVDGVPTKVHSSIIRVMEGFIGK
ncbi:MAG: DUF4392 domain-containing protein [Candidatus Bathyarchaeia archaeon]